MTEAVIKQGAYTATAIRDALRQMRKARKGSLLVTSGLKDLRLVLAPGKLGLEGVGVQFDGDDERELIRAFLCTMFWTDPTYLLDLEGSENANFAAIRLATANIYPILDQIEEGMQELDRFHDRIQNLDQMVSVRGPQPPDDVDSPSANLYRALADQPRGGHLGAAAEDAGLDEIDAAWAVVDLLDENMATVKRPPPSLAVRRLKRAELLAGEGILPALRYKHIARGFLRLDPKKAGYMQQEAGSAFLTAGMAEQALSAFKAGLESAPDSISGLEGTVSALEALRRTSDARFVRDKLIDLYREWRLPARTLRHLEAIKTRPPEQEQLMLESYLQLQDFDGALQTAKRLLPAMDAPARLELVKQFAQSGAHGKALDRVIRISKTQSLRPVRKLLFLVAALLAAATALVGAEVFGLRAQFHTARLATLNDLREGKVEGTIDHWKPLLDLRERAKAKGIPIRPPTCLHALAKVEADLKAIAEDHALLKDPKLARAFAWPEYSDTRDADNVLASLEKQAASDSFKALLATVRSEIAAYWQVVEDKIDKIKRTTNREQAFELQRALLVEHPNAPHLLRQLSVVLPLQVRPAGPEITVRWRGKTLKTNSSGDWEIKLPLHKGSAGDLVVERPNYVPHERRLVLMELPKATVAIDLFLLEAPDPTRRAPEPKVEAGLDVTWGLIWDKGRGGALEPTLPEGDAGLEPLAKTLNPGQRLRVEVLGVARPNAPGRPPRVYLAGLVLWLDHPESGKAASPKKINLKGAILPGRTWRPVKQDGSYVMEPVTSVKDLDQVLAAAGHVVRGLQKELE